MGCDSWRGSVQKSASLILDSLGNTTYVSVYHSPLICELYVLRHFFLQIKFLTKAACSFLEGVISFLVTLAKEALRELFSPRWVFYSISVDVCGYGIVPATKTKGIQSGKIAINAK